MIAQAKTITHNGVTLSVPEWSEKLGIKVETIYNRIALGWDSARIVTTPVKKPYSKGDAEMDLNDLPMERLPPELLKIAKTIPKSKRYGTIIRNNHRKEFDEWFNKTFR